MKRSMMFLHLTGLGLAGLALAEEISNGGGGDAAPWVAGVPLTTEKQPAPGEIGISPSAVPIVVADPEEYRVPRTDEPVNPVPQPVERVAEAPRLHAVEGRDKWETTPLTTILREQRAQKAQERAPVTSVDASPSTATVAVGATAQITASAAPVAASQDLTYSSSAPAIATVDEKGKVTGKAVGTATITVASFADPSKTKTVAITVE